MFDILLFDLDGTLIEFPPDQFVKLYLGSAAEYFKDLIPDKQRFIEELLKSTEIMENTDKPETTTLTDFLDDFCPKFPDLTCEQIQERFMAFYQSGFEVIKPIIKPIKPAQDLLVTIREYLPDMIVVLATNPVFPFVAVKKRMEWGGIKEEYFDHITHAENSHFCKPNLKYWREILQKFGVSPERGLVIGNDAYRDLLASKIGLKTFLVDGLVENEVATSIKPDWRGTFEDLETLLLI